MLALHVSCVVHIIFFHGFGFDQSCKATLLLDMIRDSKQDVGCRILENIDIACLLD